MGPSGPAEGAEAVTGGGRVAVAAEVAVTAAATAGATVEVVMVGAARVEVARAVGAQATTRGRATCGRRAGWADESGIPGGNGVGGEECSQSAEDFHDDDAKNDLGGKRAEEHEIA